MVEPTTTVVDSSKDSKIELQISPGAFVSLKDEKITDLYEPMGHIGAGKLSLNFWRIFDNQ